MGCKNDEKRTIYILEFRPFPAKKLQRVFALKCMQEIFKTKMCKNIEPGCKLLFDPLIPMGCRNFHSFQSYVYKQHVQPSQKN